MLTLIMESIIKLLVVDIRSKIDFFNSSHHNHIDIRSKTDFFNTSYYNYVDIEIAKQEIIDIIYFLDHSHNIGIMMDVKLISREENYINSIELNESLGNIELYDLKISRDVYDQKRCVLIDNGVSILNYATHIKKHIIESLKKLDIHIVFKETLFYLIYYNLFFCDYEYYINDPNEIVKSINESYRSICINDIKSLSDLRIPLMNYITINRIFTYIPITRYIRMLSSLWECYFDDDYKNMKYSIMLSLIMNHSEKIINNKDRGRKALKCLINTIKKGYNVNDFCQHKQTNLIEFIFLNIIMSKLYLYKINNFTDVIEYYINNKLEKTLIYFNCTQYKTINDVILLYLMCDNNMDVMKGNYQEYIMNKYNILGFKADDLYTNLPSYIYELFFQNIGEDKIIINRHRNYYNTDDLLYSNINDEEMCPIVIGVYDFKLKRYNGYSIDTICVIIKEYRSVLTSLPLTIINKSFLYINTNCNKIISQLNYVKENEKIKYIINFVKECSTLTIYNNITLYNEIINTSCVILSDRDMFIDFCIYMILIGLFIKGWDGYQCFNGDCCMFKGDINYMFYLQSSHMDYKPTDEHYDQKIIRIYEEFKSRIKLTYEAIFMISKIPLFTYIDEKKVYIGPGYDIFTVLEKMFECPEDPFCTRLASNYLISTFSSFYPVIYYQVKSYSESFFYIDESYE